MIYPDRKKIAQMIVARMKPDGSETKAELKPEEEMSPDDMGLMSAAEEIMAAIQGQSAHGLKEAMRNFVSLSRGGSEGEGQ